MFVFLLNYKHAIVQIPAVFNTLPTLSLPPHPLQLHVPSRPVAFPKSRPVVHIRQLAEIREKLVYLAMFGVLARWNLQKPASEITVAPGMGCKMRCYFSGITDRTVHVKVHDLVLEPRQERAVDAM